MSLTHALLNAVPPAHKEEMLRAVDPALARDVAALRNTPKAAKRMLVGNVTAALDYLLNTGSKEDVELARTVVSNDKRNKVAGHCPELKRGDDVTKAFTEQVLADPDGLSAAGVYAEWDHAVMTPWMLQSPDNAMAALRFYNVDHGAVLAACLSGMLDLSPMRYMEAVRKTFAHRYQSVITSAGNQYYGPLTAEIVDLCSTHGSVSLANWRLTEVPEDLLERARPWTADLYAIAAIDVEQALSLPLSQAQRNKIAGSAAGRGRFDDAIAVLMADPTYDSRTGLTGGDLFGLAESLAAAKAPIDAVLACVRHGSSSQVIDWANTASDEAVAAYAASLMAGEAAYASPEDVCADASKLPLRPCMRLAEPLALSAAGCGTVLRTGEDGYLMDLFAKRIVEELGDETSWRAVVVLAKDWSGSLDELIVAVRACVGPAA